MEQDEEVIQRIRERAYQIWLEEGCPARKDKEHWELAKLAIAQRDGLASALLRPTETLPGPEPIEAVLNQGEFPTLVDQGEGLPPTGWGMKPNE